VYSLHGFPACDSPLISAADRLVGPSDAMWASTALFSITRCH